MSDRTSDLRIKELVECSTEQTGMVGASEEGKGPHRAVVPSMMMMMMMMNHDCGLIRRRFHF